MEGGNEVSVVPLLMANGDNREALFTLSRAMSTQVNRDIGPSVKPMDNTMTFRLKDFVRMNPPIFFGSTVGKNPPTFLDEVYENACYGVTSREKVELVTYQLKDIAQVWFTQWKNSRPIESGPLE